MTLATSRAQAAQGAAGESTPAASASKGANSKRKRAERTPETLEAAFERVLALKINEKERAEIEDVRHALASGDIRRDDEAKKLSKKEALELAERLRELRREARLAELVATKPENYRIITDADEFDRFIDDLYREPIVAFDTETTGLDLFADRMVGYSAWLPQANYGVYVPFGHTTGEAQLPADVALESVCDYLEDSARKTIWHNAKFDMHMFLNHGVTVADPFFDTQVAANILNENESHRLKDLAPKYLGVKADHFDSLFGDDPTIFDKPIGPAGVYAIKDTEFTWRLYEFQRPHIDSREGLRFIFWNVEMPQVAASLEMERTGFCVDEARRERAERIFEWLVNRAMKKVHAYFGLGDEEFLRKISEKLGRTITEFNVNSPEQLAYLVYDHLALPDISKRVNPKLSPRSTSGAVLEELEKIDDRIKPLKDYREKEKLLSSFIRKFSEAKAPDGKLHYSLSQFGTDTGRYSSQQYGDKKNKRGINIQQIPARSKAAKHVRKILRVPDGYLILGSDLSQIEPRTMADMSGDAKLIEPYRTGKDLYIAMAMELYGFLEEFCADKAYDPTGTFKPRDRAKTGLLAAMYLTSAFTLAQQMRISKEEAEAFLENFFKKYADVDAFIKQTKEFVLKYGYVETKYGRKRRFPELKAMMAERNAMEKRGWYKLSADEKDHLRYLRKMTNGMLRAACNARIQGSAADMMKLIIAEMHKLARRKGWRLIATVHDEILILVPETITLEEVEEVNRIMTQTINLVVPMKCDSTIGRLWGEDVPYEKWFAQKVEPVADKSAA